MVVTGITDINSDPGCSRAMDLGMNLRSNPDTDDTMASCDIIGHLDNYDPGGRMAFGHPHDQFATQTLVICVVFGAL